MYAVYEKSADGRRLVKITFERQSPDSDSPVIEVVYRLDYPQDFRIENNIPVLTFLTATRTDTREPVTLTPEEQREVVEAVTNKAAEAVPRDWK